MKDFRDTPELELYKVIVRERRPTRADLVVASGFPTLEEAIAAAQELPIGDGQSALVEDSVGFVNYHRVGRA